MIWPRYRSTSGSTADHNLDEGPNQDLSIELDLHQGLDQDLDFRSWSDLDLHLHQGLDQYLDQVLDQDL